MNCFVKVKIPPKISLKLDRDFRDFYRESGLNLDYYRKIRESNPNHKLLDKNFPISDSSLIQKIFVIRRLY